jgi:hypothetical protein
MRIEWEADDIICGRRVGHPDRSEQHMIGYLANVGALDRYVLISLSDGMVSDRYTKEMLAARLNSSAERPVELGAMSERGRRGGKARAANLSPERRSEIASDAASTRWNGRK